MTIRRRLPGLALLIAVAALNLHCDSSSNTPSPSQNTNGGSAVIPPPQLDNFVYAVNWDNVIIDNWNYAKTTVDTAAHFTTDRNACGKDAYGAVDNVTWNTLARDVNSVITTTPLDEKNLFCVPDAYPYRIVGDVTVVDLTNKKTRVLFTFVDSQICSTIRDPGVSNEVLDAINTIVLQADKEDCRRAPGT
jgi:hypothetical protein